MAMGGVVLAGPGPVGTAANVAFQAVPPATAGGSADLALPIGLIHYLADDPLVLDPGEPGFNAFRLANLLYNPPWHYPLSGPDDPSTDIVISVAQDELTVDLGELQQVLAPGEQSIAGMFQSPQIVFGFGRAFAGLAPLVHYENRLTMNDDLHAALAEAEPFRPNTDYALYDRAHAQFGLAGVFGVALPAWSRGDPRQGGAGLFVGARAKLIRGLLYGDADNTADFSTGDTLLANDPLDARYIGSLREAGPAGGRFGGGADLGVAYVAGPLELGFGVNDLGTRIPWSVRESVVAEDSLGEYRRTVVREDVSYTSTVPVTYVASAAWRSGPLTLAADAVHGLEERTTFHAGAELWTGTLAWRAGGGVDGNAMAQASVGVGLRLGPVGLDLAVASNSRNIQRERAWELAAGLAFYH
jgi:hypothetical protein